MAAHGQISMIVNNLAISSEGSIRKGRYPLLGNCRLAVRWVAM